jgi:hypothetical protein
LRTHHDLQLYRSQQSRARQPRASPLRDSATGTSRPF